MRDPRVPYSRREIEDDVVFIMGYRFPLFAWAAGILETYARCQAVRDAAPWHRRGA